MSNISLGNYGTLIFSNDHWVCWGSPTPLGAVDIQVDGLRDIPEDIRSRIIAVLDRIVEVDSAARAYLLQHAPSDVEQAKHLVEPSLLFMPRETAGSFTIFYSGQDEDDETCYGVEFRNYTPFDLSIGD